MSEANKPVFLSYASEDKEVAKRICDALRATGVEVWFDQNELRGGDVWDAKIRQQIQSCALFVPVISAATQARGEGYFRLEWKLAVDRSHLMADDAPFLFPVVIDGTPDSTARVPAKFREVQWTRLRLDETPAELAQRITKLLGGQPASEGAKEEAKAQRKQRKADSRPAWLRHAWQIMGLAIAVYYLLFNPIMRRLSPHADKPALEDAEEGDDADAVGAAKKNKGSLVSQPPARPAPAVTDKSVAVLAFANLSDDKSNEYFSDGISEELLNVLAKVPGLKVSARTSAFYFKGKEVPIPEIAQQLGVAYVVEGSVRKSGDKVRITAQLIKAADGFHVWSDTFTRDLKDVFVVQDEIAGLIAGNLELKMGMSAHSPVINPQAFDLYLQGRQAWNLRTPEGYVQAEDMFTRALQLEPDFARAHSGLADVWMLRALEEKKIGNFGQRAAPEISKVIGENQKALALDPDSSEAHASLGFARWLQWQPLEAKRELRRSIVLNPNYATGHHWLAAVLEIGSLEDGLAEGKRAVELDPFSHRIIDNYGTTLVQAGRLEEGLAAFERALALQPGAGQSLANKALTLILLGRRNEALALARELSGGRRTEVLAAAGMKAETEAALSGASGWDRYGLLAALGRHEEALAGLNAADVPITGVMQWLTDPDFDPYRQDPRFVKVLATLNLTEPHAQLQAWRATHPPLKPAAKK